MVIRGANGRKCPLGGRAKVNDIAYFVETGGDMLVTHKGVISQIVESEKMTEEESHAFIKKYEKELNLSKEQYKRWAGKKYLAVYKISNIEKIEEFKYKREKNMDDWVITDDINKIRL
jgi:ABC-type Fe3+/spermidine/putrescine transport system ATPase subunit